MYSASASTEPLATAVTVALASVMLSDLTMPPDVAVTVVETVKICSEDAVPELACVVDADAANTS